VDISEVTDREGSNLKQAEVFELFFSIVMLAIGRKASLMCLGSFLDMSSVLAAELGGELPLESL
jgi:hypothetical protein